MTGRKVTGAQQRPEGTCNAKAEGAVADPRYVLRHQGVIDEKWRHKVEWLSACLDMYLGSETSSLVVVVSWNCHC